jgi:hypothetical protein
MIIDMIYKKQTDANDKTYQLNKEFFTLCYGIYKYINNPIPQPYPTHLVAKFLIGYDDVNVLSRKNTSLNTYLYNYNNFANIWLSTDINMKEFHIDSKYNTIKSLITNIIYWSFLYKFNDQTLVDTLNKYSVLYLQTPIYQNNNTDPNRHPTSARNKFNKLLQILFDLGFKLLFFTSPNQGAAEPININVPDMLGSGNNSYYDKYMKYKQKYTNIKQKNHNLL